MPNKISIDYSYTFPYISDEDINNFQNDAIAAMEKLFSKLGAGNDYLGWIDLPEKANNSNETEKIITKGNEIFKKADLLICIGIGGSYLGAKTVTEALLHPMHNSLDKKNRKGPKIYFAGHNISGKWLNAILEEMDRSDSIYVNVISKSGTTTEPGIAFRKIKQKMEDKYSLDECSKRIIGTTDAKKGALRKLSDQMGYDTYVIPDDVGGRFSVLTPVGLLPIAATGINIKDLLNGAIDAYNYGKSKDINNNPALMYAIIRNLLLRKGYAIEILVNYDPSLHYLSEWWKQLYGESEGKDGKGIFPSSVDFTTDLHSMGQWIQDGQRMIFETVLNIITEDSDLQVPSDSANLDGLEYLSGKTYFSINQKAFEGTIFAHFEGKVPNIIINIPEINAYYIGQLMYMFEQACGISGYLLDVNPFNQPGVEAYKKNMFALLNKPGEEYKKINDSIIEKKKKIPQGKQTN